MSLPESDKIVPSSRLEAKRMEHNMPVREIILLDNLARDLISAPPPSAQEEPQVELNQMRNKFESASGRIKIS